MSWTRRQFCRAALKELGIGNDYDASPEDLEDARARLDAMMAEWNARGIRLGYPIGQDPFDGDLDANTNVPDAANNAIVLSLATVLAPSYGRPVQPGTTSGAARGLAVLLQRAVVPPTQQLPSMPSGAGNRRCRGILNNYTPDPLVLLDGGPDGEIELP